jgi:hypothetical protein
MSALAPITRQTVGRTFIVAISVLGIGAALQLGVVAWLFYSRFRAGPAVRSVETPALATTPAAPDLTDPFAEAAPVSATATPRPGVTPPPRPTPVSQSAFSLSPEAAGEERFNELVEQGKALRQRGDTYAAVTRLREAQAMNQKSPIPPTELALTYEQMGFIDRAAEAWRTVYDMGPAAGIYYTAADGRLRLSQAQAMKQLAQLATPAPGTAPTASSSGQAIGLGPDSKLGLGDVTRRDETDPGATRKFTLTIPVKAKPRARIDVREVIVQVQFFDVVNGRALDRTGADTKYKWLEPPADFADGDLEKLEVSYTLPALRVADEERKYYGYIVTLYYKNALQDFRSDPPTLAQRSPPVKQLAPETPE